MKRLLVPFLSLLPLLLSLFLLYGCIDDDTSGCTSVISLRVTAEVSVSGGTDSDDTFNDTGVYIFDSRGVLADYGHMLGESGTNGQIVELSVEEGRYTIVTWCGADFSNDYEIVALTPSGDFTDRFVKGETRLSDMRLRAKADGVSDTRTGSLFWGALQEVTVDKGVNLVKLDTKLQKNSNLVEIVMEGVGETEAAAGNFSGSTRTTPRYDVRLSTVAGIYKFDNSTDMSLSAPYTYLPYETEMIGGDLYLRLRTMRLFVDIPATLTVTDRVTGNVVYTADLIDLIMQNPAYRTQEDLDRTDAYKIVVGHGVTTPSGDITITVNGWEIIILEPQN